MGPNSSESCCSCSSSAFSCRASSLDCLGSGFGTGVFPVKMLDCFFSANSPCSMAAEILWADFVLLRLRSTLWLLSGKPLFSTGCAIHPQHYAPHKLQGSNSHLRQPPSPGGSNDAHGTMFSPNDNVFHKRCHMDKTLSHVLQSEKKKIPLFAKISLKRALP